jgi:FkbM family methyltransferase
MAFLHKAGHTMSALHNLATYPLRFRRIGHSWRDGWTALLLRLCAGGKLRAILKPRECLLRLKALPDPLTLRRANSDIFVVRDVFENQDYGVVRRMNLPADATIVDLGANIGIASLYFASLFPQSRILAVEPDADNCDLLRRNCAALLAAGRLHVEQAFVAAADGAAAIDRSDQSWGFKKIDSPEAASNGQTIRCLAMPSLLAAHNIDRIDLLKCDIEGSEAELFANCAPWIHRVTNLVIEVHPPYSPERLHHDLRQASWEFDVCDQQQRGTQFSLCALRRKS